MFQHTLLLIYRSFLRFKSTFFINLIGLSTGLACALFIYLWVSAELSVDKFHEKDRQLYQVMHNIPTGDGSVETGESTPGPLAPALQAEIPEVEQAAIVANGDEGILALDNARLKAKGIYVTSNFFAIFSYKLMQGDKKTVLSAKHAILLSEELALKLFHTTSNIIGKTVKWDQDVFSGQYIVSGIFKKPPVSSTAQFDLLFTYDLFAERYSRIFDLDNWGNSTPSTYVVLKKGANAADVSKKITDLRKSKFIDAYGPKDLKWIGSFFLQRYSDRYLHNQYENGVPAGGRIQYVKLFSIIALFMLAIACINFMNLSTAKASRRLKEVGLKKVIGASRSTLILQYLGESMLLTFLALLLAIGLVVLLLPQFNQITGKQLTLSLDGNLIMGVLGITIFTGLVSGSYPAFYLSGFSPATVLKGKLPTSVGEQFARKGLVVFQFTIAVVLIVSVLVVYKQIEFIQTKNLGYNKDNIISFKKEGKLNEGLATFLSEVKNLPGVVNASSIGHDLMGNHGGGGLDWEGESSDQHVEFGALEVDYDLLQLLEIQMAEGRAFSREFGADSSKIIFNQAAIAAMGLKEPIGKTVKLWGREYQIVGVTKNFHYESLYEKVEPLFIRLIPNSSNVLVKIKAGRERETLAQLQEFYRGYVGLPLDYRFLDEDYQQLYAAENRVAVLSRYFAGIAILISCLGLFGLATFTAERRRKEIGVRKVLGASPFSIVYLLSSDFTKMVLTAIGLALPASYLVVKYWLNNFQYRIDLQWWYFLGAGLAALLVAWLTVSTQAIKAASVNPAQSLKDE